MIFLLENHNKQRYRGVSEGVMGLRSRCVLRNYDPVDSDILITDWLDDHSGSNLVCLNRSGKVVGALRILQTTGPNTLNDIFPSILGDGYSLRSPCLWEVSRVCIDPDLRTPGAGQEAARVLAKLLLGLINMGQPFGIQNFVCIFEKYVEDILDQAGIDVGEVIARGDVAPNVPLTVWVMDSNEESKTSLQNKFSLYGNIWLNDPLEDEPVIYPQDGDGDDGDLSRAIEVLRAALRRHGKDRVQSLILSNYRQEVSSASDFKSQVMAKRRYQALTRIIDDQCEH